MVLLLFRQGSCRAEVAGNRWDPFGNAPEPRRKHRLNHLERRQARARNPLALRNVVVCVVCVLYTAPPSFHGPPEGVTWESDRTKILLWGELWPPLDHGVLPRFSETPLLVL